MGVEAVHTHFSSRFSEPAGGLERLLDSHKENTDWFTVTEVDNNLRAATLFEVGWGLSIPDGGPRDDCGQAWDRSTFRVLHKETRVLSGLGFIKDGGGRARPIEGNFVALESVDNNHRHLSALAHLGHGIERDLKDGKANTVNGKIYAADFARLVDVTESLADHYDCESITISFDANLDVRLAWVRLFLRTKGLGYKINWKPPYPPKGTFGPRLIDVTIYRGKIKLVSGPRLVSQQGTSDHKYGYTETYALIS